MARCIKGSLLASLGALVFVSSAASEATRPTDNVILRWNQAIIAAIRASATPAPVAARAFAVVHTCVFDAWAAYDEKALGTSFGKKLRVPENRRTPQDRDKAISFAAYRALSDLFPGLRTTQFDPLMVSMGYRGDELPAGPQSPTGVAELACDAVLRLRHNDGSNQLGDLHDGAYSDYTNYSAANTVEILRDRDRWQPLLVNNVPQRWQVPQWGRITPFALSSGAQFRREALSQGPIVYPGKEFWREMRDVLDLSANLGDREKVIAEYWADGAGTATPPGHWNEIAQAVSRRDRHNVGDDAKMFFILGNALLDSSIASWDVKRVTDSIRPVSAIRATLSGVEIRAWGGTGLGTRTLYGRNFRSYLPTPPFGSFVSGHSTFSAASAEVLKRFTKSDYFRESHTVLPGSSLIERGLTPAEAITLTWNTFSEAADQAGISRRYGGIHFECDDLAGRALGRLVANEVWMKASTYIEGDTLQ